MPPLPRNKPRLARGTSHLGATSFKLNDGGYGDLNFEIK